ncbi:hypothetical protein BKM31_20500 [[Actinomadura] parvosata subsp. kistnae]|uniref:Uncharacterized protein n=1 Tax=[Actinomadura] parvosata subsp. kistnae TaxID=1909395 RepID=A0A1V0A010_9ACTN|nr:DUF6153 family protein [Nonomuraea sp. ATCC 55076]AQZ63523.1 hypothetical protein BKM31_20500 [Nonomuraea sp. ATCC 55076]
MGQRRAVHVLRAVLLVALALGVCGMHTLGHLDGRHGGSSHGMQAAPAVVSVVPAGMEALAPDGTMPGFDPTDVCLAVLMTFMVLLLIATWARVGRRGDGNGETHASARQVARPPPKLTSRRLAILSVLRI